MMSAWGDSTLRSFSHNESRRVCYTPRLSAIPHVPPSSPAPPSRRDPHRSAYDLSPRHARHHEMRSGIEQRESQSYHEASSPAEDTARFSRPARRHGPRAVIAARTPPSYRTISLQRGWLTHPMSARSFALRLPSPTHPCY
ncbi:hypothetical protein EV121DRAFT_284416 [Schizophyllum commune]